MYFKRTLIAALSLAMASTSIIPASAVSLTRTQAASSEIGITQQIQYRERQFENRRHIERRRGDWKRHDRRGWHNGHRGYREHRRGYRRHSDGWWYPLAAFGAGAVIGGAINNQGPAARVGSNRHYEWCASRYRTYRASDNTYVPSAGRRAVCNSPYN